MQDWYIGACRILFMGFLSTTYAVIYPPPEMEATEMSSSPRFGLFGLS